MANEYISTRWTGEWLDSVYPVGAIYLTISSDNPGDLFGGTWTRLENQFLLAAGSGYTAGATGGTTTHTHTTNTGTSGSTTLSTGHLPSHNHGQWTGTGWANFRDVDFSDHNMLLSSSGAFSTSYPTWSGAHDCFKTVDFSSSYKYNRLVLTATHTHTSVGSGSGHTHTLVSVTTGSGSTIPPYYAVYMWERTA